MTDFVNEPDANPASGFAMVPNHWFRDPRLSDKAKGRLGYLATHAAGYRVSIDQQIAETKDGRDAVYASIRELVELGYLERRRERDAAGRITGVHYTWGPAARAAQYPRAWGRVESTSGSAGSGKPDDGSTTSGQASSGQASSGQADTKKTKSLEDQERENQPPPPTPPRAAPEPARAGEGEEDPSSEDQQPAEGWAGDELAEAAALRAVLAAAPRRTLPRGRAAELARLIKARLAAGWTVDQVVDVLGEPLDGVDSVYATLRWRIANLLDGPPPAPPPAPRQRDAPPPGSLAAAAACQRCNPNGWVEHPDDGRPLYRCDHTQPDPAEVAA